MAEAVLRADGVMAGYGKLEILHGVSVELREREVVSIIGPNGAGKSTLLRAIFGLVPVRQGRVELSGRSLVGMPPNRIVAEGLAYVPQVANVFPTLTVDENLDVGAFLRREGIEEARERVRTLFPFLRDHGKKKVGRLSGGERQMVAIGRALMLDPRVLLLDEPSANLAPKFQSEVFARVRAIADAGVPVLLVEQNARKALATSDRGYVLDMGRNKYEGPGAQLLADEKLGRLYLGGE